MPPRSWHLELLAEAEADADAAVDYYLREAPHVVERFLLAVEDAIELVAAAPRRWPLGEGRTRRVFVKRFPYKIVYRVTRTSVKIVAIAHVSQDPKTWWGRQ